MIVRRLEQSEHGKTRSLWEEVFTEDTSAFLDYYYYIKTKDNQIYVVEEDGQICSMLQLNPYLLKIEESERPSAYIIAVATKEEYRGRGFMGNLLRQALNDMYTAKVPFTFLMPAAEAIYTPYDFRFIYSQRIGIQDISSNVASGKGNYGPKLYFHGCCCLERGRNGSLFQQLFCRCLAGTCDSGQLLLSDDDHGTAERKRRCPADQRKR